jgi:hypothetical protein
LRVKLGGRVVKKRQKGEVDEGGRSAVLSRRELVGPDLIRADPSRARSRGVSPNSQEIPPSWSRFLSPFNLGQALFCGGHKLPPNRAIRGREEIKQGLVKQARRSSGNLCLQIDPSDCRQGGEVAETAGRSKCECEAYSSYTTSSDLYLSRGLLPAFHGDRHSRPRKGYAQVNRRASCTSESFRPVVAMSGSLLPWSRSRGHLRWCHGNRAIGRKPPIPCF